MRRRIILGTVLVTVVGGAAASYAAPAPQALPAHELCVGTSNDPDHQHTQDFCITWGDVHIPR